jgi:hypothetical protein
MKIALLKPIDQQTENSIYDDSYEIVDNINSLLNSSASKKVVVLSHQTDKDPIDNVRRTIESARIALSVPAAELHVLCSELHYPEINNLLERLDRNRVHVHLSGRLNFSLKRAKVYFWPYWLSQTSITHHYYTPESIKNQYTPYNNKIKSFDCLLGQKRVNRDFVYNGFINNGLAEQSIMTYYGIRDNVLDDFILEPHMEPIGFVDHSMSFAKYFTENLMMSAITPFSVYQKTAYSIITETNADNTFSFFTEKTAKPMLGKRLFIVFNGQYFLRNLRESGFKTFDGIIDESYDIEPDNQKRWQMALESAIWLSKQNQSEIFEKIKPITEHNFQLINSNWNQKLNKIIQSV